MDPLLWLAKKMGLVPDVRIHPETELQLQLLEETTLESTRRLDDLEAQVGARRLQAQVNLQRRPPRSIEGI